jgi:D-glycero-alpha-D-manno-heptose-7-phosphate kinase
MKHLLIFDTGIVRDSEKILKNQAKISRSKIQKGLHLVNHGAIELAFYLERGDFEKVGQLMDEHWRIRSKIIPGNTNAVIDRAYRKATKAGALGGRISGAGGGGYLIIYAPPSKRTRISKAIGLKLLPFKFEKEGTKIL